jgi:RHS repeat-associated protein
VVALREDFAQEREQLGLDNSEPGAATPKVRLVKRSCSHPGCDIAVQNQSVGESVRITGTPLFLRYQSDRLRADANSSVVSHVKRLGGWTLSVQHLYDTTGGELFLGYGGWRNPKDLGTVRQVKTALSGFSLGDFIIPAEDGGEVYVFDQTGRHLRTLHPLTGAVFYQFSYDSGNRLIAIADGSGNATNITRDGSGNPTRITSPYGQNTDLKVDNSGYIASITNPSAEAYRFVYAPGGLLTTLTRPRGNASQFSYDSQGYLVRDKDPAGGSTNLSSSIISNGWSVDLTTPMGRTTAYDVEILSSGQETWVNTFPTGLETEYKKNSAGTLLTNHFPNGIQTSLTLSPDPRWAMVAPLSLKETISTPAGLVSTVNTARTVTLTDANNPFSLAAQSDTLSINGRTYTSVYNAANRTFTGTSPAQRQFTVTLETTGRPTHVESEGLASSEFTYDSRGRLVSWTQGTGSGARKTGFSYNSSGFLQNIVDPLGATLQYSYSPSGRVTQETLRDGATIGYGYDTNGNLTSVTTPGRAVHTFSYNPHDLVASYTPPKVSKIATTLYTYNGDKQLTRITHPDGQTLDFGYDFAGRGTSVTLPAGKYTFSYSSTTGNLTTIKTPVGDSLSYSYDGSLPMGVSWAGQITGTVNRTCDNSFRTASESVNGTDTISFQYDVDSLLILAGNLALSRDSQNGLISGSTLGGIADARTYDGFAELIDYSASHSSTILYKAHYTRDQIGRITQKAETIGGVTDTYAYAYDTAGRLITVQKNNKSTSTYTYDANGNGLTYKGSGRPIRARYDKQDRLTSYGSIKYTYDANGRLQRAALGRQAADLRYDLLGNLLGVTLPDGTVIDYILDGQNRRIGKKINGARVQGFLYQGGLRPVADLDGSNNAVSRFVYATRVNVPDYMLKNGHIYRIITDHLGSPRLVIDAANGAIAQRMDYDEFGIVTNDTSPGFQPFGFAGGLYDPDTGLVRFGARDYDADVGRWTARDPILFESGDANLYNYVASDPINYVDPIGQIPWSPDPSHPRYVRTPSRGPSGGSAMLLAYLLSKVVGPGLERLLDSLFKPDPKPPRGIRKYGQVCHPDWEPTPLAPGVWEYDPIFWNPETGKYEMDQEEYQEQMRREMERTNEQRRFSNPMRG